MSRARQKGARAERRVAGVLGGRRAPLSGAAGGGDVWLPAGSHWDDWLIEVKSRARPSWTTVREALAQAETAARGTRRRPLAVIVPDRQPPVAVCRLEDLRVWAQALAEPGAGHRMREVARQVRRVRQVVRQVRQALEELEGIL